MRSLKYCNLYIVRHGQTEWNVKGLLQGHTDSPLTDIGISQAEQIREELKHIHFDEVFSSDSLRAKRTAEIITLERKIAVKTTQLLRERSFGKYEGKEYRIFNTKLKELVKEFEALPDDKKKSYRYPDIESDEELISRFIVFLRETAIAYGGKTILVVSHGAMIRSLLIHLGFGTYSSLRYDAIGNGAYVKLVSDGVDFFVKETKGITKSLNS